MRISFLQFLVESEVITRADLKQLEKTLDAIFKTIGVDVEFTKHFLEQANNPRNGKQITVEELRKIFTDAYTKHANKIKNFPDNIEAVLTDIQTNINVPFVVKYEPKSKMLELVGKTVMRKKGFVPNKRGEQQLRV